MSHRLQASGQYLILDIRAIHRVEWTTATVEGKGSLHAVF